MEKMVHTDPLQAWQQDDAMLRRLERAQAAQTIEKDRHRVEKLGRMSNVVAENRLATAMHREKRLEDVHKRQASTRSKAVKERDNDMAAIETIHRRELNQLENEARVVNAEAAHHARILAKQTELLNQQAVNKADQESLYVIESQRARLQFDRQKASQEHQQAVIKRIALEERLEKMRAIEEADHYVQETRHNAELALVSREKEHAEAMHKQEMAMLAEGLRQKTSKDAASKIRENALKEREASIEAETLRQGRNSALRNQHSDRAQQIELEQARDRKISEERIQRLKEIERIQRKREAELKIQSTLQAVKSKELEAEREAQKQISAIHRLRQEEGQLEADLLHREEDLSEQKAFQALLLDRVNDAVEAERRQWGAVRNELESQMDALKTSAEEAHVRRMRELTAKQTEIMKNAEEEATIAARNQIQAGLDQSRQAFENEQSGNITKFKNEEAAAQSQIDATQRASSQLQQPIEASISSRRSEFVERKLSK
eukprot:TRINITY_DN515_c0_g1_i2.p1 TRINITY_DN515_c0_g1~~TRINITY_DN515_c0_g1_i2.p1  ORF type:complete len:514 (+),score=131.63 TRINITY_DN515_c0_g1_i2:70-1542(+)